MNGPWARPSELARAALATGLAVTSWGVFAGGPLTERAPAKEAVVWIESYEEAIAEARRTGKAIFLEYRCAP